MSAFEAISLNKQGVGDTLLPQEVQQLPVAELQEALANIQSNFDLDSSSEYVSTIVTNVIEELKSQNTKSGPLQKLSLSAAQSVETLRDSDLVFNLAMKAAHYSQGATYLWNQYEEDTEWSKKTWGKVVANQAWRTLNTRSKDSKIVVENEQEPKFDNVFYTKLLLSIEESICVFLEKNDSNFLEHISESEYDDVFIKNTPEGFPKIMAWIMEYYVPLLNTTSEEKIIRKFDKLIPQALSKISHLYTDQIPLYDTFYKEFLSRRESEQIQEVYIGRDTQLAFEGQRSREISQRRLSSVHTRIELKKIKGGIEVKPTYLIYPRTYKDGFTDKIKEQYIHDQGVLTENNPVILDFGLHGSIPEDIFRILGYPISKADSKTLLLSTDKVVHRPKGFEVIVEKSTLDNIENNPKNTRRSINLYKNARERLSPIEVPSSLEEQFVYFLLRKIIRYHYYSDGNS